MKLVFLIRLINTVQPVYKLNFIIWNIKSMLIKNYYITYSTKNLELILKFYKHTIGYQYLHFLAIYRLLIILT